MENRTDAGKYPIVNALWTGLSKPLFCAVLMSAAALLLIEVQGRKAAFDKRQNAPYVIVSDANPKPADDVHYVPAPKLADAVQTTVRPAYAGKLFVDPAGVVIRSADDASAQNFKNPLELFAKLKEGIVKQKNAEIGAVLERNRKARLSIDESDQLQAAAKTELDEKATGPKVDVSKLATKDGASYALQLAIAEYAKGKRVVQSDSVRTAVANFYDDRRKQEQDTLTTSGEQISSLEKFYQTISDTTYQQLTDGSSGFVYISPATAADADIAFLLDDKKGLNGLYWLLRVVLSGIVVFAFLYLILIPLKYVFFWTTSADILTEHARKLLERKDAITAATPVARAAIVAVTAATVGTVALAASNLPLAYTAAAPTSEQIGKELARDLPRAEKPPSSPDLDRGLTTAQMEVLMTGFSNLGDRITQVEDEVSNFPRDPFVVAPGFANAVRGVRDILGAANSQDVATVFGKINGLQSEQKDFNSSVTRNFESLDGRIGKLDDPFGQPSLFGRLNRVSDTLGMRNNTPQPELTVVDSLRNLTSGLGTSTSTDNSTLFGKTNSTQQSVTNLTGVADSIRRDQLGTSGRNLFTQAKTMFSGERFRVSAAAVAEIERELAIKRRPQPELVAAMRQLVGEKLYSEGELKAALGESLSKAWSESKSTVLRYTRVARY